jgi:thiamine-monophosphate kinase
MPAYRRQARCEVGYWMDLHDVGEFGLVTRIRKWMTASDPALVQGIGDDVAVMERGGKALLATTDILIEDIHFDRSWMDPYRLGKKSLAVNLSDIAAMGGIPKYFLISLGLPKNLPFSFISWFYRGIREGAKRYRVNLVGGDTSLSEKMIINICLLGEGKTKDLVFRSGASVGDELFVSGTLGDSALGLKILQKKGLRGKPRRLIEKHLSPCPRLQLGQAIAQHRCATAMIDVSDGLLSDTHHLLEESGVGAMIWEGRIPLSRSYLENIHVYSKDPYAIALSGGEDYELLFTASPEKREKISSLSRSFKIPITCIGKILPRKKKLRIVRKDGKTYSPSRLGFDHFR